MFHKFIQNMRQNWQTQLAELRRDRYGYVVREVRRFLPIALFLSVVFFATLPTFAQEPIIDIDPDVIIEYLLMGANVIIGAVGLIMFLIAGFKLGGVLLRAIVDTVANIRI